MKVLARGLAAGSLIALAACVPQKLERRPDAPDLAAEEAAQPPSGELIHTRGGTFDPTTRNPVAPIGSLNRIIADDAVPYIVQFTGRIQAQWTDSLRDLGVEVVAYVPDDALLVRTTEAVAERLAAQDGVRALWEQAPILRIDPLLLDEDGAPFAADRDDPVEIDVEVSPAAVVAVTADVEALGGEVLAADGGIVHARLGLGRIFELAARTDVEFVAPHEHFEVVNDRSRYTIQAGGNAVNQTPVWDRGLRGQGQTVGFADTGLATFSCYFGGDKVTRYEDLAGNGDGDGDGHGTHVAGSIAGDRNNNGVYDTNDGMAPAAQLFAQDIGRGRSLVGIPSDLGDLFASPFNRGVRIHSNSWGSNSSAYTSQARSIDAFMSDNPSFLVLVANGNAGPGSGTVGTPATAKNVVSVGAAQNGSSWNNMANFSSHGPTDDGRIKPTVSAPGQSIVSAAHNSQCGTRTLSGTSMATPTTAGAVALIRQYYAEGFYPSGQANAADGFAPSAALMKATLLAGTRNMGGSNTRAPMPSNGQGFGMINLDDSLYFTGDSRRLEVHGSDSVAQGAAQNYDVTVNGGTLRVALAWTDPPGATFSSRALVNDLNLVVSGPGGTFRGNVLQGAESVTGGSSDDRNVEEVVHLSNAPAGAYRVTVSGANVPFGPQVFAVVINGDISAGTTPPPPPPPPPPGGNHVDFAPTAGTVGWTQTNDTANNHLGDDDVYAGNFQGQDYLGVVAMDVSIPSMATVTAATLELVGQTTQFLGGGTFAVEVVDVNVGAGLTHAALAAAPVLATLDAAVPASALGANVRNTFTVPAAAIRSGAQFVVRLRGNGTTGSVMSWDSGFGTGGLGIQPVLGVDYTVQSGGAVLEPDADQVGWAVSVEATGNHVGDDDVYAGVFNNQTYVGVIQVDATGLEGRAAELALTGQTTQFLGAGSFTFELVALGAARNATYADITQAPVLASLGTVPASAVGAQVENVIAIDAIATSQGLMTIRIRGATADSVMSWDSGYGTGGLGIVPVIRVP